MGNMPLDILTFHWLAVQLAIVAKSIENKGKHIHFNNCYKWRQKENDIQIALNFN